MVAREIGSRDPGELVIIFIKVPRVVKETRIKTPGSIRVFRTLQHESTVNPKDLSHRQALMEASELFHHESPVHRGRHALGSLVRERWTHKRLLCYSRR